MARNVARVGDVVTVLFKADAIGVEIGDGVIDHNAVGRVGALFHLIFDHVGIPLQKIRKPYKMTAQRRQ